MVRGLLDWRSGAKGKGAKAEMNGEMCSICGKPMGNSAHTIMGRPTHSHCFDERSRISEKQKPLRDSRLSLIAANKPSALLLERQKAAEKYADKEYPSANETQKELAALDFIAGWDERDKEVEQAEARGYAEGFRVGLATEVSKKGGSRR